MCPPRSQPAAFPPFASRVRTDDRIVFQNQRDTGTIRFEGTENAFTFARRHFYQRRTYNPGCRSDPVRGHDIIMLMGENGRKTKTRRVRGRIRRSSNSLVKTGSVNLIPANLPTVLRR
ncbi:hypothetical protein ZHAS_00005443 [Anopheles sinensis]|uniref:Uncharacterized protein n=1 Tax=Anopheles sinensis TaxID=74873 RepID=A0A084VJK5_ANOSI|nr:hypothetical protein ZHAS_00005443 [Anopheles sinensis]